MADDWTGAVVVDPRALQHLERENSRLRTVGYRQRCALAVVAAITLGVSTWLGLQSTHLSTRLSEMTDEARQYRKASVRANSALTALARSHEEILTATEQAPNIGTKSWGRRFTVTKYLPRSPLYGKFNTRLTSTLMKADPDARLIAVDPKLIPYGSWVWIEGLGWYRAEDCGAAIKGYSIDVLTATEDDATAFGRQDRFAIVIPADRSSG
jgi:3D (Asp-Asp-Asp) domain-containing protein